MNVRIDSLVVICLTVSPSHPPCRLSEWQRICVRVFAGSLQELPINTQTYTVFHNSLFHTFNLSTTMREEIADVPLQAVAVEAGGGAQVLGGAGEWVSGDWFVCVCVFLGVNECVQC